MHSVQRSSHLLSATVLEKIICINSRLHYLRTKNEISHQYYTSSIRKKGLVSFYLARYKNDQIVI